MYIDGAELQCSWTGYLFDEAQQSIDNYMLRGAKSLQAFVPSSQSRILANEHVCTEAHSLCDDASLVSMHAALIQHRNSGFYLHALSAVQAHSCS